MRISEHISYYEATRSNTARRLGIRNVPGKVQLENMRLTAQMVFEPIRKHFDKPLYISSFFRSKKLNAALGGSTSSDHCRGRAIDIDEIYGTGIKNFDVFMWAKDNVEFDQLIAEFPKDGNPSWVHISYREGKNRGQILVAKKRNGRTVYEKWTRLSQLK